MLITLSFDLHILDPLLGITLLQIFFKYGFTCSAKLCSFSGFLWSLKSERDVVLTLKFPENKNLWAGENRNKSLDKNHVIVKCNNKTLYCPMSLAHLVRDIAQYVQGLEFEPRTPHLFILRWITLATRLFDQKNKKIVFD